VEALPKVPEWKHKTIKLKNYETQTPMVLYYREGLDVVKHLFANPVFAQCLELHPYQLYEDMPDGTSNRVYSEFMSGDWAWEYQVSCLNFTAIVY